MNVPDGMVEAMITMLDDQYKLCTAYDEDIRRYMNDSERFIDLMKKGAKENDKYITLYHTFGKLLNWDFDPKVRTYHFIHNEDGRHSIVTGEL